MNITINITIVIYMDTVLRRPRCRLCREEGHNYRTCPRVEVIHQDLIYIFRRIIVDNAIMTLGEGFGLRCRWLHDYSIVALRALARKHGLSISLSKDEYCNLFKRLYFTIAFHEIQVMIGDQILRDVILQLITLQEERVRYQEFSSYWIDTNALQIPLNLFPIQLNENQDMTNFDCPICFDTIEKDEHKITINCGHRFCEPCMFTYLQLLRDNIDNNEPIETCTPKCALCRSVIFSIDGDIDILNNKFKDKLSFI